MRVGELLHELRFSLQGNAKVVEGARHADRDAQFRYINEQVTGHLRRGEPVVSVDTKKKELIGDFKQRRAGVAAAGRAGSGEGPRFP